MRAHALGQIAAFQAGARPRRVMRKTTCRFCGTQLEHVFADLGMSPLANSFLSEEEIGQMEPFYPLRALVCHECFLVQLEDYETPDAIFSDYAYFSSYSSTWLDHSRRYAEMAVERFELDERSQVVELASNDGYLLQYFVERGVQVLGIEPAANVARVAQEKGIRTMVKFFGRATAREIAAMMNADLLIGNNVLAHVPDLNDFVGGMKILLAPDGVLTMEFPHLLHLIDRNEWDTIYHEHFSYFSFLTVSKVFAAHGLTLFDVEELATHGGSLRIYGRHADDHSRPLTERASELLTRERELGFDRLETYLGFSEQVRQAKLPGARHPHRAAPRRQDHRRLRRPGEGEHAAQLLRGRDATSSSTRATSTRTSRGTTCPARASRSARRRRCARRVPTWSSSCPGT